MRPDPAHARRSPHGARACCRRCGAVLYRERHDSLDRVLMLTIAALILFVLAHAFPFMTFKLEGREQLSTLLSGVVGAVIATACGRSRCWSCCAASLFPLLKLLGDLCVLLPLRSGRRRPRPRGCSAGSR